MTTSHGDEGNKPKPILVSALLFAGFEALGFICTDIAEGLEGDIAILVHWIALCCSAAGFFAAWHEMVEGKNASRIWTLFGVLCIVLALIAYLVWHPHTVESKPMNEIPHFTFSLSTSDSSDAKVLSATSTLLTNDFFALTNFGGHNPVRGGLGVPLQPGQSNIWLRFSFRPRQFSESVDFVVTLPKNFNFTPESGWQNWESENLSTFSTLTSKSTNETQSFVIKVSNTFPGDTVWLPGFLIKNVSTEREPATIMAKANNLSPECIVFEVLFLPQPIPVAINPVVALRNTTNGVDEFLFVFPSKTNELHK